MRPKVRDHLTKKDVLTIPNLMSMFRILLIPVMIVAYTKYHNIIATILLLILSGISDIADGWVARKFDMVSDFGKVLDPVADKLTQLALMLCLVFGRPHMWYLVILLVVRETIMFFSGLISFYRTGQVGGAEWHGKLATCVIYTTMVLHILWIGIPDAISDGLVVACFGMMALSLVLYSIRNINMIRQGATQ